MKKRTIARLAIGGALACLPRADAAWNTGLYTNEVDGIKWQFKIDESNGTALLGAYEGTGTYNNDNRYAIVPGQLGALTGEVSIPRTLTVDGASYTVSSIGNRSFYGFAMTGVSIPDTVDTLNIYAFIKCTNLTDVVLGAADIKFKPFQDSGLAHFWAKGPKTVADGTQGYTTANSRTLFNCKNLKLALFGPHVKVEYSAGASDNPIGNSASGATFLFPRNAGNDTWNDPLMGGVDPDVVFYGPGEALDIDGADGGGKGALTFIPRTEAALAKTLELAPTLARAFGVATKIRVTNAFEIAVGTVTPEKMQHAVFDTLTFKANTQAQLDGVLAAVPASVPFAVDAADAKESLIVPQGREVYVRLSGEGRNGKYTPKINGHVITFR